jgi:hypothetical protein
LWLEAGAGLGSASSAGLAADLFVALGPSFPLSVGTRSLRFTVPVELTFGLPRSVQERAGDVEWSELGVAALARLSAPASDVLDLGAGAGGKLAFRA